VREFLEGSQAIAQVVARCRPQVVPAYPITPQTHIVEAVGRMVDSGELDPCVFITVESEFAAMSAAIGCSAMGSRAYTATASQGLLYMAEALFNASGLGLPIVMTVANRAIGAPINIWNDQSDSMSQRDCGWIQLYAEDNQSAVDLHPIAFALAERLSTPVMVCVDGFVLTHAFEPIELPSQAAVDAFLPPFVPRQVLDPDEPVTIGAMVGPEAFTEVRYEAHQRMASATDLLPYLSNEYRERVGRAVPSVSYTGPQDASTIVVALGSANGTMKEVAAERSERGDPVGVLSLTLFRPFPYETVRAALGGADRVIVLERAFAPGAGGIVTEDVRKALAGERVELHAAIVGLGGRPVRQDVLHGMLDDAAAGRLADVAFIDLLAEVTR